MIEKVMFRVRDDELNKLDQAWKLHSTAHNRSEFVKAAVNYFSGTDVFGLNDRMKKEVEEARKNSKV